MVTYAELMTTERRTVTAPNEERPADTETNPVIGFRIAGTNVELSLPNMPLVEIGASRECDVVLADRLVSAFHATVERRDGHLWFLDRGSKNGSIIRGKKKREAWIDEGTLLVIGSTPLLAYSARLQLFYRQVQTFLGLSPPVIATSSS